MVGWPENWPDRAQERGWIFVCILHAVSGEVSVLSVLAVIRINNLRVYNAGRGPTPAASTIISLYINYLQGICNWFLSASLKLSEISCFC
jgi:hypothetical protein